MAKVRGRRSGTNHLSDTGGVWSWFPKKGMERSPVPPANLKEKKTTYPSVGGGANENQEKKKEWLKPTRERGVVNKGKQPLGRALLARGGMRKKGGEALGGETVYAKATAGGGSFLSKQSGGSDTQNGFREVGGSQDRYQRNVRGGSRSSKKIRRGQRQKE